MNDISQGPVLAMKKWVDKYQKKNNNYGNSWLLAGETLHFWFPGGIQLKTYRAHVIYGLIVRMLDKLVRASNLEILGNPDLVGETSSETFFDLGVYAFMAGCACFVEEGMEAIKEFLDK